MKFNLIVLFLFYHVFSYAQFSVEGGYVSSFAPNYLADNLNYIENKPIGGYHFLLTHDFFKKSSIQPGLTIGLSGNGGITIGSGAQRDEIGIFPKNSPEWLGNGFYIQSLAVGPSLKYNFRDKFNIGIRFNVHIPTKKEQVEVTTSYAGTKKGTSKTTKGPFVNSILPVYGSGGFFAKMRLSDLFFMSSSYLFTPQLFSKNSAIYKKGIHMHSVSLSLGMNFGKKDRGNDQKNDIHNTSKPELLHYTSQRRLELYTITGGNGPLNDKTNDTSDGVFEAQEFQASLNGVKTWGLGVDWFRKKNSGYKFEAIYNPTLQAFWTYFINKDPNTNKFTAFAQDFVVAIALDAAVFRSVSVLKDRLRLTASIGPGLELYPPFNNGLVSVSGFTDSKPDQQHEAFVTSRDSTYITTPLSLKINGLFETQININRYIGIYARVKYSQGLFKVGRQEVTYQYFDDPEPNHATFLYKNTYYGFDFGLKMRIFPFKESKFKNLK